METRWSRLPRPGRVLAALALVLAFAACAPASPPTRPASDFAPAPTAAPLGAEAAAQAKQLGQPAPEFTARLLEGGSFTLSEQRGRPVLVIFTASWCSTCIPEVNKMAQLQEEFGARGLRQLALSVDPGDTPADFAGLRQRTRGQNLLWALDPGQKATLAYRIQATDTKVLIDERGSIVFRSVGPTPADTLRRQVSALLP